MRTPKNFEELNKEMRHLGLRVNEKGEIFAMYGKKESILGHARPITNEEKIRAEKIDRSRGIKRKIKLTVEMKRGGEDIKFYI